MHSPVQKKRGDRKTKNRGVGRGPKDPKGKSLTSRGTYSTSSMETRKKAPKKKGQGWKGTQGRVKSYQKDDGDPQRLYKWDTDHFGKGGCFGERTFSHEKNLKGSAWQKEILTK